MSLICSVMGHTAQSVHHHNQGLDFALCHKCGCDLVRAEDGDWTEVPKGFRVVWREFGREADAGAVAARMQRHAPAPRRREPRGAPPKQRRDRRGPAPRGPSLMSVFGNLGDLLRESDPQHDPEAIEPNGQYVIRLPWQGDRTAM